MLIAHCFIDGTKSCYIIYSATIKNSGQYYCQVRNQYGEVDSNPAKVTEKVHCTSPSKSEKSTALHSNEGLTIFQTQDFNSPTDLES